MHRIAHLGIVVYKLTPLSALWVEITEVEADARAQDRAVLISTEECLGWIFATTFDNTIEATLAEWELQLPEPIMSVEGYDSLLGKRVRGRTWWVRFSKLPISVRCRTGKGYTCRCCTNSAYTTSSRILERCAEQKE